MSWVLLGLRLVLTIIAAGSVGIAQRLVFNSASVDGITSTSARFVWQTNDATSGFVQYGVRSNQFTHTSQQKWLARRHVLTLGGLKPDTRYYYRVVARDLAGTLHYAPVAELRTAPAPAPFVQPDVPEAPDVPSSPPAIDGRTWTVQVNAQGRCTDFQERILEAAAEPGVANHEIVVPAGARCVGTFELPERVGDGWIVIRSSRLHELPEGQRVSPRESPAMAVISGTGAGRDDQHRRATLFTPYSSPTRRWYLAGLEITHEREQAGVFDVVSVEPVAGGVRITTASPHGFGENAVAQLYNATPSLKRASGYVRVLGDRTLDLLGTGFDSVPTAGAKITVDPAFYPYLWASKDPTSEVVIDRCYLHGQGFPDRLFIGIQFHGQRLQLQHSWLDNVSSWRSVRPDNPREFVHANAYLISVGVDVTASKRVRVFDNHLESYGISFFSQEFGHPLWTQDIDVTGNRFPLDDRYRWHPANPHSDGLYYPVRLLMEYKRGARIRVDGNLFENLWNDTHSIPAAVLLSSRNGNGQALSPQYLRDIAITNNVLRRNGAGIIIYGSDDSPDGDTLPASRVRIANNLIYGGDANSHTTANGEYFISYRRGWCLGTIFSTEDILIDHNNCIDPRGTGPMILWQGLGRGARLRVENNIFSMNGHSGLQGIFFEGDSVISPVSAGSGVLALDAFRSYAAAAPDFDPNSDFHYNVIIPGLRDATNPACSNSADASCNIDQSACLDYFSRMPRVSCVGGATPDARINAMAFAAPELGDFTLGPTSVVRSRSGCRGPSCTNDGTDPGVSMPAIWAATRMVRRTKVEWLGDNVRFRYQAPGLEACRIDLWDATSTIPVSARWDEGGEGEREFWLPVQDGGRLAVSWRIACRGDIATGRVAAPAQ